MTEGGEKLYLTTPVMHSSVMSQNTNFDIYLKLDNLQPPGSFKIRGISNMCQKVCHICGLTEKGKGGGGGGAEGQGGIWYMVGVEESE